MISADVLSLKAKIRADLPPEAFEPQPYQALWAIPLIGVIVAGSWLVLTMPFPWYVAIPLAILIGNSYAILAFLAHEVLHGNVVRSHVLENIIGYCAFFIFLLSPSFWRVGHVAVHHRNTNQPLRDPETVHVSQFQHSKALSSIKRFYPSRPWSNLAFLFVGVTVSYQLNLWIHYHHFETLRILKRRREIMISSIELALWVFFAMSIGWRGTVYAIIIPMFVANFIGMSYVVTNHFLSRQVEVDDPLVHSISLIKPGWLEKLYFNFNYHIEHHLFPEMNAKFSPLVRQSLMKHAGDKYVAAPHWKALWAYLRLPHVYRDEETLVNPSTGRTVKISDVVAWLLNDGPFPKQAAEKAA